MYVSMTDIRETYQQLQPEGHWFDRSSMRFFRTRLPQGGIRTPLAIYFTSSEQFVSSRGEAAPRKHSVRRLDLNTGNISTVGEFNTLSASQATDLRDRHVDQDMMTGSVA